MENDVEEFRERIRDAVPAKVARLAGIRPSTLYSFLDGKTSSMRADTRDKVASALEVLLSTKTGRSAEEQQKSPLQSALPADEEVITIPVYDISASAGPGSIVEDGEPVGQYPMMLDQLRAMTRAPSDKVAMTFVRGESMEPELQNGDRILVDRSVDRFQGDFIYMLERSGVLFVKAIKANFATKDLQVISFNEDYGSERVTEDDIRIIGKVLMYARVIG